MSAFYGRRQHSDSRIMNSQTGFIVREPKAPDDHSPRDFLRKSPMKGYPRTADPQTARDGNDLGTTSDNKRAAMTTKGRTAQHHVRQAHEKEVHVGGSPHTHNSAMSKAREDGKRRSRQSEKVSDEPTEVG